MNLYYLVKKKNIGMEKGERSGLSALMSVLDFSLLGFNCFNCCSMKELLNHSQFLTSHG